MIYICVNEGDLQDKEAGVKDARVDKDGAELSTLKQLIGFAKKEVVCIQHHHPVVINKAPRVQFI